MEVTEIMKTDNTLLDKMLSEENLGLALAQVRRNRGACGIDGMEVSDLKDYLDENLDEIKESIRKRTYKPQPVKRVEIPKPDGGVRKLGVPTVLDRFVQQAIAQVLIPIYEPKFSDNSFGFRPNRCCEMAIIKALEYMNDGFQWVVDIDLEKFFDTVNHDKLISLVMKDVKSGEIVSLIRKFLVSGIMVDKEYKESIIGTPQGGLCRYRHNPPCGVPIIDSLYSLSTMIPLTRNFLMSDTISPLFTSFITRLISLSWLTVSKNFSKSISTTHWNPSFMYSNALIIAISQHLFGLNPKLLSLNFGS